MAYGKLVIAIPAVGWNRQADAPFEKMAQLALFPDISEEEAQRITDHHGSAVANAGGGHVYEYAFTPHAIQLHPSATPSVSVVARRPAKDVPLGKL